MAVDSRIKKMKLNIVFSLGAQFVTLICSLIIPALFIRTYGSETYGATASIAKFLSYISLLEGGVFSVASVALYKPLAENDTARISEVITETKSFFRVVACIFVLYTLILACTFKYIAKADNFEWNFLFGLVIVMSISSFAQYFIGFSYSILLEASQKLYVIKAISIIAIILNAVFVVVLVSLKCDLIIVKLVSGLVFLIQPVGMALYVRKHFKLDKYAKAEKKHLTQKWDCFGQHLAYQVHFQTDITVLTIFTNLSLVAVYSVYNMVIYYMQMIIGSFLAGLHALFGDMLAKEEYETLKKTFDFYETMISVIAITLFSVTAVMIVSFVELYTAGVTDVNYKEPVFAVTLVLASVLYCLRIPYHELTVAAGHFKQTNKAAYGEAAINVVLSIALLRWFGLCGIAVATVIATGFRFLYYVFYLSENIIFRSKRLFVKRQMVNGFGLAVIYVCGSKILQLAAISNYLQWVFAAIPITLFAGAIVLLMNVLFYKESMSAILGKILHYNN